MSKFSVHMHYDMRSDDPSSFWYCACVDFVYINSESLHVPYPRRSTGCEPGTLWITPLAMCAMAVYRRCGLLTIFSFSYFFHLGCYR